MPTVPTTFVPQVAPPQGGDIGQFQAPGVQPMQRATIHRGPDVLLTGQPSHEA